MNSLRNKVVLIGNLGNAPDIKTLSGGKKFASLSLATNENYTNKEGEKVTETQWHKLTAWGKTADLCENYLSKGSHVAIEGKLVHRDYLDNNGIKRYVTEVEISELLILEKQTTAEVK